MAWPALSFMIGHLSCAYLFNAPIWATKAVVMPSSDFGGHNNRTTAADESARESLAREG